MSSKSNQLMIAGIAGVAAAIGVTVATIQSNSSQPSAPTPTVSSVSSSDNTQSPAAPSPTAAIAKPSSRDTSSSGTSSHGGNNTTATHPSSSASAPQSSSPQPSNVPSAQSSSSSPLVITAPIEGCKISMAVVNDPNPPLNVRRSPEVAQGNIVGQLNNNTFVSVADEQNGWLRIAAPVEGWIAKNRTESSCPNVTKPVAFLPGGDTAIIKGRIIGGGSHNYVIQAAQGQTMTVKNLKNVFPAILGPDSKLIAGDPYTEGNRTEWSGKLPVSGKYTLQLDSNFKGFEYEFQVQVK